MAQTSVGSFRDYTCALRSEIDTALDKASAFDDDCPPRLRDAIRHSLLAPGKRLRPILVLIAAESCGYDRARAMPAACAVEMVHTYSLIHDDLPAMDDDDLRRGLPTCHAKFGEATAILAGDGLLAAAFERLATEIEPAEVAARCCQELATAAGPSALVGGQMDDLIGLDDSAGLDRLEQIHRRKTGAMFQVSVRLGGIVGGGNAEQIRLLDTYGKSIGLAFQIVDDLLDVRGNSTDLGKRTGKDQESGKLTFPTLLGVDASAARARQLIDEAISAADGLGTAATHLKELARFVLERDR